MAATGIIAPNIKWYVNTSCGTPAVGGTFATFNTITGAPMPTYADPGLTQPNPVIIGIGSDGAVMADLYWKVGTDQPYYTIVERDKSGKLIKTWYNYPIVGGTSGGDITVISNSVNFGQNEQFAFWPCGTSFDTDALIVGTTPTATAWYYTRSNDTANITISEFIFPAGDSSAPYTPKAAMRYQVTVEGADAVADITQRYADVQTLQNQEVTVGIWAATNNVSTTAQLSLVTKQVFGAGGSPTIETIIGTFTIDDTFAFYPLTFVVEPIAGNVIGTNSYLEIGYRFSPEQIQDVLITDYQFQLGTGTGIIFPYVTENLQYAKVLANTLAGHCPNTGTDIIGTGSISTPTAQDMNLTQYLQESFFETKTNLLIGWNFYTNPNQFGQTFTDVDNNTYIADQTILLSDGDGVVTKDSFIGEPLVLTVEIAAKKFGIFQIIETLNCTQIQGFLISLAAGMYSSAAGTFRMAILGWSGSIDAQARDCVDAWNVVGTNPTLVAGWNYLTTPEEFITTTALTYFKQEAVQTDITYSSYGVFIWLDGADLSALDTVSFAKVALVEGINATDAENLPFETVLRQCQRYFQRSYDYRDTSYPLVTFLNCLSVLPSQSRSTVNAEIFPQQGDNLNLSSSENYINFYTEMYKAPTVTIYNPENGAAASAWWFIQITGGSLTGGSQFIAVSTTQINTKGFLLSNVAGAVDATPATTFLYQNALAFHYTANATLGV